MMRTEDTGTMHITPDDDYKTHVCHGDVCPCDPYKTDGGNVIIHRHFNRKDD